MLTMLQTLNLNIFLTKAGMTERTESQIFCHQLLKSCVHKKVPRRYFFCGSFVFFVSYVSHAFASVHCCLVVTCWERADLLALASDVYYIFVTFPCGILGQVWYLIVSFPDFCILSYFDHVISLFPYLNSYYAKSGDIFF